ncbi:MAG TPA: DUF4124 domain-containing protein [Rhodanobacteraceae bacterium]
MIACKGNVSASTAYLRWLGALPLLLAMQHAHGASIFKCVDASGVVAFQDTACAKPSAQAEMVIRGQPLIDPRAPAYAADTSSKSPAGHARVRKRAQTRTHATHLRSREDKQLVSYECRASDGEVFYRHSKCPATVPGDGIARFGADQSLTGSRHGRRGSRGGAWAPVSVTSREIPRDEACRQINAVTAGGRDGHARDQQVSVYDHDLGRDPCGGG